jgi:hypothetical protein
VPIVTTQPLGGIQVAGNPLSLVVAANVNDISALPLQYQWLKDGVPIAGATNLNFSILSATTESEGDYSALITSGYGYVVKSDAAFINVVPPLQITGIPSSVSPQPSQQLHLAVTISSGEGPFSYEWRKNNLVLTQFTGSELTLPSGQWGEGDTYQVTVSNTAGSQTLSTTIPLGAINSQLLGFVPDLGSIIDVAMIPNSPRLVVDSADMGIVIVDTSTPVWRIVASENPPRRNEGRLAVSEDGNHVFVMGTPSSPGRILDISNLANIHSVAPFPFSGKVIKLRGSLAYIAAGTGGLQVVDVGTITSPNLVASISSIYAGDIAVSPTMPLLYVAADDSLKIYNILQSVPALDRSVPLPGLVRGVGINAAGTILAVSKPENLLGVVQFFDLTTPNNPIARGSSSFASTELVNIKIAGTTAFVYGGGGSGSRRVFIDVSNLSTPRAGVVGSGAVYGATSIGNDFIIADSSIARYQGTGSNYNLVAQLNPQATASYSSLWPSPSGNFAVVGRSAGNAYLITTSVAPIFNIAASIPVFSLMDVTMRGNYGFLVSPSAGLAIYNLAAPTTPALVTTLNYSGKSLALTSDGHLYVAGVTAQLHVLNVQDPTNSTFIRSLSLGATPASVVLNEAQTHAFVLSGARVTILDVSTNHRENPVEVGSLTLPSTPPSTAKVKITDNKLFVPTATSVYVYNILDPLHPSLLQTISSGGTIETYNGLLLISRGVTGTEMYRFNPAINRYVLNTTVPPLSVFGNVLGIAVRDGKLFANEAATPLVVHTLGGI